MIRLAAFPLALIIVLSTFSTDAAQAATQPEALAVLKKHCARCHDGNNSRRDQDGYDGDFLYLLDVDELIRNKIVIAAAAEESELFTRLEDEDAPMPPLGKAPAGRVAASEKKVLRDWINSLRPQTPREPISLSSEFEAMAKHLRRLSAEERSRIRFFSLRTAYNNPNIPDRELELQRLALAKTINSLSWQRELVRVQNVLGSVLYALDLNDVRWQAATWEAIAAANPYALRYDSSPADEALNDLAAGVYHDAKTYVPSIRVDWFVAAATRPPLYHDLLDIPEHEKQLERTIGIHAERNILDADVVRAGTDISGVSNQNRLVERHGNGSYGYYWKSYDFLPEKDSRRSKLLNFPLGPMFDRNPHTEFAFEHDGGELIFRLPNGLQGYMLVDARGGRIDEGPSEVVEDKSGRWSGSAKIVNGLSCMGCHANGLIDVKNGDRVRDGSGLSGRAGRFVRRVYPGNEAVQELIDKDRKEFREACVLAMQTISSDGTELATEFGVLEPIGKVAKTFVAAELDLKDIAADLDIENRERLSTAIEFNEELRSLGLLPVAKGAKVPRSMWQFRGALTSRFQRAAIVLDAGTAHVGITP